MMLFLLAQAAPDALAGSSGWVGAGLLGLVLGWLLMVHIPRQDARSDAKDKLFLERLEAKDAAHAEIVKLNNDHCREEMDAITENFFTRMEVLFRSKV